MKSNPCRSVWNRTPKSVILLLGVVLGSSIGLVAAPRITTIRRIAPIYGVLKAGSAPDMFCLTADHPISDNTVDDRTICAPIPRDTKTGQAIELPPLGARIEAGFAWMPRDSWDDRTREALYVIPEETTADRLSRMWAPQCYRHPCAADTPEEAARQMVLSLRYGALTPAEVDQQFQVQATQPITQGMVVFYTRAEYRAAVRSVQRACARLILPSGKQWSGMQTKEHCLAEAQSGAVRWSIAPDLNGGPVYWGVFGQVNDAHLQAVEVLSDDGIPVRGAIRNGRFFVLVPGGTAPARARLFDQRNRAMVCDLRNRPSCG